MLSHPENPEAFLIVIETFSPLYSEAYNFVICIAEPLTRPEWVHEYELTEATMRAALSLGYTGERILEDLQRYNKYRTLDPRLRRIIRNLDDGQNTASLAIFDVDHYIVRLPAEYEPSAALERCFTRCTQEQRQRDKLYTLVAKDVYRSSRQRETRDARETRDTRERGGRERGGAGRDQASSSSEPSAKRAALLRTQQLCVRHLVKMENVCEVRRLLQEDRNLVVIEEYFPSDTRYKPADGLDDSEGSENGIEAVVAGRSFLSEVYVLTPRQMEEASRILARKRAAGLEDRQFIKSLAEEYRVTAPYLFANLKPSTELRDYQLHACKKVVSTLTVRVDVPSYADKRDAPGAGPSAAGDPHFSYETLTLRKANSGLIVLPCGAGKSLLGIACAIALGHSCLVVTNGLLSSKQWKNQFLQFSTIDEDRIYLFDSEASNDTVQFIPGYHTVFIGTYHMLTSGSADRSVQILNLVRAIMWGIVLFDEAHQVFAETFRALFIPADMASARITPAAGAGAKPPAALQGESAVGEASPPGQQAPREGREGREPRQNAFTTGRRPNTKKAMADTSAGITLTREVMSGAVYLPLFLHSYCKLGLTATPLREDKAMENFIGYLGSKLYESNWSDLSRKRYIASLQCAEIVCSMDLIFYKEYATVLASTSREISLGEYCKCSKEFMKNILGIMNPKKIITAYLLKEYHCNHGDQVLIFCDCIVAAKIYGQRFNVPFIIGDCPESEREVIINAFSNKKINCIILSAVGDTSLDLPDANVIIELGWQRGSRRQETQRIGRISRPKSGDSAAYFYILVSDGTNETVSAPKRREYLEYDQGYPYSILSYTDIIAGCDEEWKAGREAAKAAENGDSTFHVLSLYENQTAVRAFLKDLKKEMCGWSLDMQQDQREMAPDQS